MNMWGPPAEYEEADNNEKGYDRVRVALDVEDEIVSVTFDTEVSLVMGRYMPVV